MKPSRPPLCRRRSAVYWRSPSRFPVLPVAVLFCAALSCLGPTSSCAAATAPAAVAATQTTAGSASSKPANYPIDEDALATINIEQLSPEQAIFRAEAIALQGGWIPPPGPLTAATAKRLLTRPAGSLSVGVTSRGRLTNARKIKLRGKHYSFFDHIAERQTYWGTDEMQRFITRVSDAVARKHRGAELRLGNVSLHRGGRSPWHHSHQAGRDVDICFYARDRKGRPVRMENFQKFRGTGFSRNGELIFDAPRNLDVVLAMLDQEETPVQWIFVARWLKRKIMAVAQTRALPPQTILRLTKILRQPGDSAPHDDHFHVRLFCSLQDRKYGCLDRGPRRRWVDSYKDAFDAHVQRVAEATTLADPKLRLRAVHLLARIEARQAGQVLLSRLADEDDRVRRAALHAIMALQIKDVAHGVLTACSHTAGAGWAIALFDAWAGLGADGKQDIAATLLQRPSAYFHKNLHRSARLAIILRAIDVLANYGRRRDVPTLIAALNSPQLAVRLAAHEALIVVTNQRVRDRYLRSKSKKKQKRTVKVWRAFWRKNQRKSWLHWMKIGLRSYGVRLGRGKNFVRRDVPRLIRALTSKKGPSARNAAKVLVQITGHKPWLRRRGKQRLRRHWRYWWRKRGRRVRLRLL